VAGRGTLAPCQSAASASSAYKQRQGQALCQPQTGDDRWRAYGALNRGWRAPLEAKNARVLVVWVAPEQRAPEAIPGCQKAGQTIEQDVSKCGRVGTLV